MDILVPHNGRVYTASQMNAVDQFLEKMSKVDMWTGIEFLVERFLTRHPEWKDGIGMSLRNEFGASDGLGMRLLAKIPTELYDLIDYFYRGDIGKDKNRFYREFAKRFPIFAVPDKI